MIDRSVERRPISNIWHIHFVYEHGAYSNLHQTLSNQMNGKDLCMTEINMSHLI